MKYMDIRKHFSIAGSACWMYSQRFAFSCIATSAVAPSGTVSRIHHQQALWVALCSYTALRVQMLAKEVRAKETKVLHVTELQLLFLERFPSPQHCNQPHLTAVAAGPSPSQLEAVSSQLCAVPRSPHLSLGAVSFILYPCKARQSGACTAVAAQHREELLVPGLQQSEQHRLQQHPDSAGRRRCSQQREQTIAGCLLGSSRMQHPANRPLSSLLPAAR